MISPEVTIRQLTLADIPMADELRRLAGWNQTPADWRDYLALEPEGCFCAEVRGQPAGTATTIRYEENKVGWIGMVLVHPQSRRFGIGTALLRGSIEHLKRRGVRSIKLDATPMGKTVYLPLGFREEYEIVRYEGSPTPLHRNAGDGVEGMGDGVQAEIAAFDAPIFGASRPALLGAFSRRKPELCFVAREQGRVSGYLIAREGGNALQLGPWIAWHPVVAARLLDAFCARAPGRRAFLDTPDPNLAAHALVTSRGFVVQRGFSRMFLGGNESAGRPEEVYGTAGAENG